MSAERLAQTAAKFATHIASTEPHSCECGEEVEVVEEVFVALASTEPHSCECGENAAERYQRAERMSFNGAALV